MKTGKKVWLALGILAVLGGGYGAQAATLEIKSDADVDAVIKGTEWVKYDESQKTYKIGNQSSTTGNTISVGVEGKQDDVPNVPYNVYGGTAAEKIGTDVSDNKIIVYSGKLTGVYGGQSSLSYEVKNNTVEIHGGEVSQVAGGRSLNAGTGVVTENKVIISGGTVTGQVYGGFESSTGSEVSNNTVTISGSAVIKDRVNGGVGGIASSNKVSISGGTISNSIFGAYGNKVNSKLTGNEVNVSGVVNLDKQVLTGANAAQGGTVVENSVTVMDGNNNSYANIFGGDASSGTVKNNRVNIVGGTLTITDANGIVGGLVRGDGTAEGNVVTIDGATITGTIMGGRSWGTGIVKDNEIHLKNDANLQNAVIQGGASSKGSTSGNRLVVHDQGKWTNDTVQVKKIDGLTSGYIDFEDVKFNGKDLTLEANEKSYLRNDTKIRINSIDVGEMDVAVGTNLGNKTIYLKKLSLVSDWSEHYQDKVDTSFENLKKDHVNVTENGISAYGFDISLDTANTSITGNDSKDDKITISAKVNKAILTGKYTSADGTYANTEAVNEDGSVGTGTLKLGTNGITSTKANVITGAYNVGKDATGGYVVIEGDFTGDVYGGYSEKGSAVNNSITLKNVTQDKLNLIGGQGTSVTGNTLTVDGQNTVGKVSGFESIQFENVSLKDGDVALTVTDAANSNFKKTNYKINSFATAGGTLTENSTVKLLKASADALKNFTESNQRFNQGGVVFDGELSLNEDGDGLALSIGKGSASASASDAARSHVTALGFLNEGSDLVLTGIGSLAQDDVYGIQTFAATERSDSSYDGGTDIDGWKVIAGVGAQNKVSSGALAWGIFAERGLGSYTTSVDHGSGDVEYNGGGAALRYTKDSGVYAEASIRLGKLHDDVDGVLGGYDYDTSADYKAFHAGVGKLIKAGSGTWDVYGKYFYTKADGASFTVNNQYYDLSSIESQRIRLGARYNHQANSHLGLYYGAAWEYEFDGDADGSVAGYALDTASLGGSTFLGEVGLNYKPQADSRWDFEFGIKGYGGERDGVSAVLRGAYHF